VFVILLAKAMGKLKLDQAEWEFLVSPDMLVNKIETKSELTWMLDSHWRMLQQLIELPNYLVRRPIDYDTFCSDNYFIQDVTSHMKDNEDDWKKFYLSENPSIVGCPKKFDCFKILPLLKCIRPDLLASAVSHLVEGILDRSTR
jgi:hypothetical protein